MTEQNFETCMVEVRSDEGGYVNHPKDPGGETNYGISKRSYPRLDIKTLTWEDAKKIYRHDYWNKIRGGDLPQGVDYSVLDPAINSGNSRAIKLLQAAVGVKADGKLGPQTLEAVQTTGRIQVIQKIAAKRLSFMMGLKTWKTFKGGWSKRVAKVEAISVRMAGVPPSMLLNFAYDAKVKAKSETQKATVAGTGSSGLVLADFNWPVLALAGVAVVVVVYIFISARRAQLDRAEAYLKEAEHA